MFKALLRSVLLLAFLGSPIYGAEYSKKPIVVDALGGRMLGVNALTQNDNYIWYEKDEEVRDVTMKVICTLEQANTEFVVLVDPQTNSAVEVRGHHFIYLKYFRVDGISTHKCDKRVVAIEKGTLKSILQINEEKLQIRQVAVVATN